MRNKQRFLDDAAEVLKKEVKQELNVVEDAAHLMNQFGTSVYTIPEVFTVTGKDESFNFTIEPRPKTDDPTEEINDYFYQGRA